MASYGITVYGASPYGGDVADLLYTAPNFTLSNVVAGRIDASWGTPRTGEYGYDSIRLLRSSRGIPSDHQDGVILAESAGLSSYIDEYDPSQGKYNAPQPGRFYYYGLFVHIIGSGSLGDTWVKAAGDRVLVAKYQGNDDALWGITPGFYRKLDSDTFGENGHLRRFLRVFGNRFDFLRTEMEALRDFHRVDTVDNRRLSALADQMGVDDGASISERLTRRRVAQGVHVQRTQGTEPGMEAEILATTGWVANASVRFKNTTAVSYNRLLRQADGLHLPDIGGWRVTGGSAVLSVETGISLQIPVTGTVPATTGVLKVSNGSHTIACYDSTSPTTVKNTAIPYAADTPITTPLTVAFSVMSAAGTLARLVRATFYYYDSEGRYLGEELLSSQSTFDSVWTRAVRTAAAAPSAGTYYVGLAFNTSTAFATPAQYFGQVAVDLNSGVYEEPRKIKIALSPDRWNLSSNPSAEATAAGWSTYNATGAPSTSTTRVTTQAKFGSASIQVVPGSTGRGTTLGVLSPPAVMGMSYTYSVYVFSASVINAFIRVFWNGSLSNKADGVSTPIPANTWTRVSLTATVPKFSPDFLTDSGGNPITTTDGEAVFVPVTMEPTIVVAENTTHFLDGALIERGDQLFDYFDGSFATTFVGNGHKYHWRGGAAHGSHSAFYRRYDSKIQRLATVLPDFLPGLSQYSFVLADDATTPSPT